MYDFNKDIFPNEKIIYQGRPVSGTGKKNILVITITLICFLFCQFSMLLDLINDSFNFVTMIAFLIILSINIFLSYTLIYNLFLKKRAISDDYYCITDQRVLKYEAKKDTLCYGYLIHYEVIEALNIKNNYGDVRMEMIYNQDNPNSTPTGLIKSLIIKPDLENMPYMTFESIENPNEVARIAIEARDELLKK